MDEMSKLTITLCVHMLQLSIASESVEDMLTRLDEFQSLIHMVICFDIQALNL